jgi:hypothetical protein
LRGLDDIFYLLLIAKLGIVYADYGEIVTFVFVVPFPDPGNYPLAVNSAECPELQENHSAAHRFQIQGSVRIKPYFVCDIWRRPQIWQVDHEIGLF